MSVDWVNVLLGMVLAYLALGLPVLPYAWKRTMGQPVGIRVLIAVMVYLLWMTVWVGAVENAERQN